MSVPHLGFIVAAYLLTFVVVLAMIIGVLADHRSLRKTLSKLDSKGGDERP
jgi:heme exporter protein CcmD